MLYQFHYCFIAVKHIFEKEFILLQFKNAKNSKNFLSGVTVIKSTDMAVCNNADKN